MSDVSVASREARRLVPEPAPPFFAHDADDGLFVPVDDAMSPLEAAQEYAWGHGLDPGDPVWVAWGSCPNPEYVAELGDDYDNMPLLLEGGPVEYKVLGFRSLGTFAADGREEFIVDVLAVEGR